MPTVLIVEDEPMSRFAAEQMVQSLGFETIATATGEAALDSARRQRIDLLFTDIQLPGDIDGWAVARALKQMNPAIRVIYTSGRAGPEEHATHGVTGSCLLPKPYSDEDLAGAIEDVRAMDDMVNGVPPRRP
jgi:CheY-like chemotaxis protein